MGDVDGGGRSGAEEGINGLDKQIPMICIQTLAWLVQDEQAGLLDQSARQQDHALQTC